MRALLLLLLPASTACKGLDECGPGESPQPDGSCAEVSLGNTGFPQALVDEMPDCTPLPPGDRLDVALGCVDGACVSMSFEAVQSVLQEEGECSLSEVIEDEVFCTFSDETILVHYTDENGDGSVEADQSTDSIHVNSPWDGADPEGLGLGISSRCFLDRYGEPESWYTDDDAPNFAWLMYWPAIGLFVLDSDGDSNGTVDGLGLYR